MSEKDTKILGFEVNRDVACRRARAVSAEFSNINAVARCEQQSAMSKRTEAAKAEGAHHSSPFLLC